MVKAPHEGEKFAVVDVVVAFGVREGLRVKTDCSMFTPVVYLCEDSPVANADAST